MKANKQVSQAFTLKRKINKSCTKSNCTLVNHSLAFYHFFRVHSKFTKNCNLDPYCTHFKNKDSKEREIENPVKHLGWIFPAKVVV